MTIAWEDLLTRLHGSKESVAERLVSPGEIKALLKCIHLLLSLHRQVHPFDRFQSSIIAPKLQAGLGLHLSWKTHW